MIPRLRPTIGMKELATCLLPAANNAVPRFEQAFAMLTEQEHAISFPYGRTALVCLLEALGIRQKEIICPAWTCVVVPHAIVESENEPVFVDCATGDYNMDLAAAAREIGAKTGAIIPTSIFGHPVDLDALDTLRQQYPHIPIIQDCAHSFSASWKCRQVQKEGIAAIFGLNISKLLTSIFGGMVTTDDASLAKELVKVRAHRIAPPVLAKSIKNRMYLLASSCALLPPIYGTINKIEQSGLLNRFVQYYDEKKITMPHDWLEGMSKIQAEVGIHQIRHYTSILDMRREAAAFYSRSLAGVSGVTLPRWHDGATWSHYTIRVKNRDELLRKALKSGIQLGWLIEYCIPELYAYRSRQGYRDCPEARMLASESVNLPVWGGKPVAERVGEFLKRAMPKSCTPGKAGGLKGNEPLKAVLIYEPPKGAAYNNRNWSTRWSSFS